MKILLAHVYCLDEDRTEMEVMRPYPPLGILYVSGYLQLKGIEHAVFDGTFLTPHAIYDMLLATNPDVVAFYANFLTRERIVKILDEIRINPAFQNIKTVIGGPDVRYHQKEYMNSGADFLVIGEGEQTFHELIVALKEKKNVENIPGLSLKNANGEIVQTGERKHFSKPDELPWPNREKIDLQKYLIAWKNKHGYNSITVNTQRGCPYSCRWCSHAVFGDTYRRRSPANVIDEIEYLQKRYNPDSYWFVDDVFTMSEKWINEFESELRKRDLKISYECITRADRLNDALLQSLKNTGCRLLWIGAESGSQKVIDLMDRRVDVHKVREMIQKPKKTGIETGTFIMLGYPGETMEDIHETVRHLKESQPDQFTINLAYPIKGTALYNTVENKITSETGWPLPLDRDIQFKRTYKPAFYNMAIRMVYNSVYADKYRKTGNGIEFIKHKMKSLAALLALQFLK